MKINDLVRAFNDPIEGPVDIPEGTLGVVVEIKGVHIKVKFPRLPLLTYKLFDISVV